MRRQQNALFKICGCTKLAIIVTSMLPLVRLFSMSFLKITINLEGKVKFFCYMIIFMYLCKEYNKDLDIKCVDYDHYIS